MPTPSLLKKSLLAACLVSVGLAGCSKDKKKDSADKQSPAEASRTKDAPKGDKANMPTAAAGSALAYLPADCTIAIHADVTSILANPVVKAEIVPALREALASGAKADDGFRGFLAASKVDPFADLHEFSACVGELPMGGGSSDPKGIITLTGNIGNHVFAELVKSDDEIDAAKIVDMKGQKAIDDKGAVITQMTDGSLSGGNVKALLVASIDKPNAFAADFKALSNADIRIVVPATTVKMGLGMPGSPFSQFVEKIDGATSVSIDLAKTTLTVKIGTTDEDSAKEIVGMAKLMLGQVPKGGNGPEAGVMAALAAAKTSGEGKNFVMTMLLPAEQFEMASKMIAGAIRSKI
tara:strand:- start:41818 stop:42870 length:1053 start_codon:yes stop_codon:yes gene_type:complete